MCRVKIVLKGFLARYAGADSPGGLVSLDLPRDATIREAIGAAGISPDIAGLILLNGRRGTLETCLADDDIIMVYPLVAGG